MMIETNQFARVLLGNEIRQGLLSDEFCLHYQPQFSSEGELYGVEALARWYLPVFGWVSPARFIPMAEESGAIIELGDWVICTACQQLRFWQSLGIDGLTMSINVSTTQISRPNFPQSIADKLCEYDLKPASLTLEITETDYFEHFNGSFKDLEVLRDIGVNLALDDFGIGHSSFQWLAELPVNILKLDRSFVRSLNRESTRSVVRNLFQMASDLSLKVVAEGVETEVELGFLQSMSPCHFQGFLMGRPRDAVSVTSELLMQNQYRGRQQLIS